jgi:hypothetical protein
MITATIENQEIDVIGGWLSMPRVGRWLGDLSIDTATLPSGNLTITLAGVDMLAHVQRREFVEGLVKMRVVGGTGGIGNVAKPKHYRNPTVRHILTDLIRDAGETLSQASSSTTLDTSLGYWTSLALPTGALIQALADAVENGCCWRILYDGTLWFGKETWPACPAEARIISQDAQNASQVVGTDVSGIWPGTALNGRHIDHVHHSFDGEPRSTVTFAEGTA